MSFVKRRAQRSFLAAGTILAVGMLLGLSAPSAVAQQTSAQVSAARSAKPGDNGDVKIHRSTTPTDSPVNQPKVCVFYLAAFNFDPFQRVHWNIRSIPPGGNNSIVASGMLIMNSNGHAFTQNMSLPKGHYKLFWFFQGEHGKAKHKVFKVTCTIPPNHHRHHRGGHVPQGFRRTRHGLPVTG